jgi:Gly-Xaa carboxypeptidase
MLKMYGEDSFALLVDEGSEYQDTYVNISRLSTLIALAGTYEDIGGSIIATPGITEKGYFDTRVAVSTPGGHSSVPPPHTVSCHAFW